MKIREAVNALAAPFSALLKWLADILFRLRSWVTSDWQSYWPYGNDDDCIRRLEQDLRSVPFQLIWRYMMVLAIKPPNPAGKSVFLHLQP